MTGGFRTNAGLGLSAFRHRNYRLFFAGQAISLVGTWMQQVAQAWLVLELTHDPLWLGLVTAAQFLPVLVFGLFAGVLADALPKRRTLIAAQVAMMLLAFLLWALVLTGAVELWMILVIALLLGAANAVDMPVRQAFSIELVGREDLVNSVALNSAMFNGARVIGPAVAGLVIAATDIASAFLLNGLSFVAVIVSLFFVREHELHSTRRQATRPTSLRMLGTSMREGIAYVWRTPIVLASVVVVSLISVVALNFQVLVPPYAQTVLGVGADGFGFLMAATGVGSLVAALALAFGRRAPPLLIGAGAVVLGIAQVGLAVWTDYGLALALQALAGVGVIAMAATANATIQLNVPDELRGRVISVYTTLFVGASPFGALVVGWLASTAGVITTLLVTGVSATLIGVLALVWIRRVAGPAATRPIPAEGIPDLSGGSMAPLRRR